MYGFILSMWVARRIDEEYLTKASALGRITEEEKQIILATPQIKVQRGIKAELDPIAKAKIVSWITDSGEVTPV